VPQPSCAADAGDHTWDERRGDATNRRRDPSPLRPGRDDLVLGDILDPENDESHKETMRSLPSTGSNPLWTQIVYPLDRLLPAMTPTSKQDLLPGTLDMLVLKTLTVQPMHGYGIAQHLQRLSRDVIRVEEGSLYPALQRMRHKGWIKAEWRQTPNNQRARYYTVTPAGRRQLGEQTSGFAQLMAAIQRVMTPGT
jgi:PadR family transcriptional regulator, regulatory protein PadR